MYNNGLNIYIRDFIKFLRRFKIKNFMLVYWDKLAFFFGILKPPLDCHFYNVFFMVHALRRSR